MGRFCPTVFTASGVASMLASLDVVTPYLDREMGRYSVKLSDTNATYPDVFVAENDEGEAVARRAAAEAVIALPRLHTYVVGLPGKTGYSDKYWVGHLDVGRGEIDAVYIGSVNALWHNDFRKDAAGRWCPVGDESSVIELPAGVDCSPIPSNYDPLSVESEDSVAGSHLPSGPVDLNDSTSPLK